METLFTNNKFIKVSIATVAILALFLIALFVNTIKEGRYIGAGIAPTNVITVSGTGEVTAVSDIATISINITKNAGTTAEAQKILNDSITKVLAYLKDQKIDDKDIKSEYGGMNPRYESTPINCFAYPCPQPEPKIVGYTANQNITIKIRNVDSANEIKTGLAKLDISNISGPTFSIDNEDNLKDQARAKAINNAKEKAEVLARQLGVKIVRITNFSENGGGYPMMYAKAEMAMDSRAGGAPAPVLPKGENKITSNVSITYEIR